MASDVLLDISGNVTQHIARFFSRLHLVLESLEPAGHDAAVANLMEEVVQDCLKSHAELWQNRERRLTEGDALGPVEQQEIADALFSQFDRWAKHLLMVEERLRNLGADSQRVPSLARLRDAAWEARRTNAHVLKRWDRINDPVGAAWRQSSWDFPPDPVPLRQDEHGTIRVDGTRVPLDLVIKAHREAASPETIVRWFDSLQLADVYAVLAYCLNHRAEVDEYLARREQEAVTLRRELEATGISRPGFGEELKARKARMERGDAKVG
jgi:uncharacterized protein (DUF433 family)